MEAQAIYDKLKEKFGDEITEFVNEPPSDPYIIAKAEKFFEIAKTLRDEEDFSFDFLTCISSLDLGENLAAVYHLYSLTRKHRIAIKVVVPKDNPKIPSVESLWRAADWHEREAYDMMGIEFEGHHNLIRILTPYDWEGHPLRKDYQEPEEYHGIKVPF